MIYDLAISKTPLRCLFSYKSEEPLELGERVLVDLHGKKVVGYVVKITEKAPQRNFKKILERLDRTSFISPADVGSIRLLSEKFFSPPGLLFDLAFPSFVDDYAETVVEACSPLMGFDSLSLKDFLERYGQEGLKNYLNKGYVKVKKSFGGKTPKPRLSKWYAVFKGDFKAMSHLKDEIEYDVISYLIANGYATVEQLVELFGISTRKIKQMEQEGVIELTQFLPIKTERNQFQETNSNIFPNTEMIITGSNIEYRVREVIRAMENIVREGRAVLFLVPLSSLAYVMAGLIRKLLDVNVQVYHARISRAQKARVWIDSVSGKSQVIVGTRIAAFLPVKNLGLIVVEESEDDAYYQFEEPVYDALELVEMRAKFRNIPLIISSCEPRLIDFHRRQHLTWLKISKINQQPDTIVVDTGRSKTILSEELIKNLKKTLLEERAAVVLVRRKGFSPYIICFACNHSIKCPNCDVTLSFHRSHNTFKCHQCGYTENAYSICPNCGARALYPKGAGTERIERLLRYHIPNAKIERLESDETDPFEVQEKFFRLQSEDIDILVGSKLVIQGIGLDRVGLICILDYDGLLAQPDYNTRLRMFQFFRKVCYYFSKAKILIQTFHPEDSLLKAAFTTNTEEFYILELEKRKELGYPPFCDLIQVVLESDLPQIGWEMVNYCASLLESETLLGPVEHPIFKLKGKFRYHFLIKTGDLQRTLDKLGDALIKMGKVGWKIFVNPPRLW